jgi:hypothetical protein
MKELVEKEIRRKRILKQRIGIKRQVRAWEVVCRGFVREEGGMGWGK